jgi:hypothetical protein
MSWLSDNWKMLFDGVGGAAVVTAVGYLLKRWIGSERKSTGQHTKVTVEVKNSPLRNSAIAGGSQNNQTVNAHTINTETLNITSHASAETNKPVVIFVVLVLFGILTLFSLRLYTGRIPGVVRHGPDRDSHGHPQPSDANREEIEIRNLQDSISDLVQYKDRVPYSNYNRMQLKDAAYLADRMSGFNDDNLRLRYRYVKYEYTAFAFEMAAVYVMPDAKAGEYAGDAIKNTETALLLLKQAEQAYQDDEESKVSLDWAVKDDSGRDRVLYIKTDALCLLGKVKNDPALKSQALETWKQISPTYRTNFPARGTPELNGCIPITKSE